MEEYNDCKGAVAFLCFDSLSESPSGTNVTAPPLAIAKLQRPERNGYAMEWLSLFYAASSIFKDFESKFGPAQLQLF
jgi:hypothetical protein